MRQFYMRRIRAIASRKLQLRLIYFSPLEEEPMAQRKPEQEQCQRADGRHDDKKRDGIPYTVCVLNTVCGIYPPTRT